MRRATGRGGELFLAGEPARCAASLLDCGDGFDWRAADRSQSYWVEGLPLSFQCYEHGVWRPLVPLDTYFGTGRAGFGRSLRGLGVRAEGTCLPLSRVGSAEHWELRFRLPMLNEEIMGGPKPQAEARPLDANATLYGSEIDSSLGPLSEVLVRLPFATGVFWGFGELADRQGTSHVTFNGKGVSYDPC